MVSRASLLLLSLYAIQILGGKQLFSESIAIFRDCGSEHILVSAAKEHPTDWSLAKLVEKRRAQPLYSFVQAQGNCVLECLVLDNFKTLKPMFK